MTPIDAISFANQDLPNVGKMLGELAMRIEPPRVKSYDPPPLPLRKQQVREITAKVYSITDNADKHASIGMDIVRKLESGSEAEIEALEINAQSIDQLASREKEFDTKLYHLKHAFMMARMSIFWAPHIQTLRHLEMRALRSFTQYASITAKIAELASHYLEDEDDLSFSMDSVKESINSEEVRHPSWVKSGDDFVKWIRDMKH